MIENLNEHQPNLLITDKSTGELHIIPLATLRDIANGRRLADNELIKIMAMALLNNTG